MDIKEIVQKLIANEKTPWKAEDEEKLLATDKSVLNFALSAAVADEVVPDDDTIKNDEAVEDEDDTIKNDEGIEEGKGTENTQKDITPEEYIGNAPKDIRDMLTNGLNSHRQEQAKMIKAVLANKRNKFTKEQLQNMEFDTLKHVANIATEVKPNYLGQEELGSDLADNASADEEPLVMPTMKFASN